MRKFLKIPWVVIGLVLLVTGFLSYQIFANIRLDNDVTRFIPEENPARVAMSEVDDLFGSQMTMLVGLESTDGPIFTPEKLGAIREVTEKLERVVNVNEVTSLMNTDYILSETIGDEEVIEVQSLVPEDFGGSLAEIQEIKRRILSWDLYHRSIVSDDYTSTQIILELEEIQAKEGEEDPKRLSYDGITRVLTETDLHGMKYYLAGTPAMSALMSKNMTADLSFLIPLVVVIVIGALYFSFRRLAGIILPLLTVIISTIWTIGFMATFGVTLTMIGTIIPVLMIAVGSAYGIHVISHYLDDVAHFSGPWNQEANIDMIVKTLRKVGKPVLLAALTTIAGFGSLSFTTIIPMQTFGIFTAVGVAAALVIALTFLPSLLVVFPPRKNTKGAVKAEAKETKGERGIHKFLLGLYNNFVSKKVLVLSIGAVLLALAGLGTSFVVIDNALVDYFKEDTEISLSDRFLREKFNGTKTFSIVLESENKGGMNNPEALLVMDALAQELYSQHDQVKKILSYTDLLKRLNQLFHSDESALGLPTKLALEDEGLSDFGFGFDAEGGSEGFGFDSAESSEGFGFDSEESSEGFGFDSGDSSEGFGFDSGDDLGDFGVFDSPGDEEFIPVEDDPNLPKITAREEAVLDQLWLSYTSAEERLVTMGSLETNFAQELPELQALNPAWEELSYDPESDAYETLMAASRLVNYDGRSYYEIPADPARYGWETTEDLEGVIGNLLFLLSDGLDGWADDSLEPTKVRMMVQMNTKGNIATGAVEDTAVAFLEENLPEGYSYMVAGVAQVEIAITDLIVGAQTSSILISIIIVFLILSVYFKSPIAGLVGTVPLSVSIMINFGLMGLFQINLDMSTAMVASIAIGIGIDYTIHFMSSYHHYARDLEDHGEITRKTLLSSGKAILFNALSVGLGFGVLALSAFRPLTYMGILIGITMFTASFAAMTLLPALLGVIKPKFMKKTLLFEAGKAPKAEA